MCADSTTPSYLAVSGGLAGTCAVVSIIPIAAAARVEALQEGLLRRLALAGSASDLKIALLRCSLGCYVADCACPTQNNKKEQAWKEVALHPPLFAEPAGPAGAAEEELLLLNAAAVGQHHIRFARLRESVYVLILDDSSSTPSYSTISDRLA